MTKAMQAQDIKAIAAIMMARNKKAANEKAPGNDGQGSASASGASAVEEDNPCKGNCGINKNEDCKEDAIFSAEIFDGEGYCFHDDCIALEIIGKTWNTVYNDGNRTEYAHAIGDGSNEDDVLIQMQQDSNCDPQYLNVNDLRRAGFIFTDVGMLGDKDHRDDYTMEELLKQGFLKIDDDTYYKIVTDALDDESFEDIRVRTSQKHITAADDNMEEAIRLANEELYEGDINNLIRDHKILRSEKKFYRVTPVPDNELEGFRELGKTYGFDKPITSERLIKKAYEKYIGTKKFAEALDAIEGYMKCDPGSGVREHLKALVELSLIPVNYLSEGEKPVAPEPVTYVKIIKKLDENTKEELSSGDAYEMQYLYHFSSYDNDGILIPGCGNPVAKSNCNDLNQHATLAGKRGSNVCSECGGSCPDYAVNYRVLSISQTDRDIYGFNQRTRVERVMPLKEREVPNPMWSGDQVVEIADPVLRKTMVDNYETESEDWYETTTGALPKKFMLTIKPSEYQDDYLQENLRNYPPIKALNVIDEECVDIAEKVGLRDGMDPVEAINLLANWYYENVSLPNWQKRQDTGKDEFLEMRARQNEARAAGRQVRQIPRGLLQGADVVRPIPRGLLQDDYEVRRQEAARAMRDADNLLREQREQRERVPRYMQPIGHLRPLDRIY